MWQLTATQVPGLSGTTDVTGATDYTCARRDNGTVRCWGNRAAGLLGDGLVEEGSTPTPVPVSNLNDALEISATATWDTNAATCALVEGGGAVCWGNGEYGQQGSGAAADQDTPFPVEQFP